VVGAEPHVTRRGELAVADVDEVGASGRERRDLRRVSIESDGSEPLGVNGEQEGEPDVAHADDGDGG